MDCGRQVEPEPLGGIYGVAGAFGVATDVPGKVRLPKQITAHPKTST